ncbi:hypothetical protein BC941DRAFT_452620 [Chlamydoabsidia padenii]|nr:hypothetical protein BC941DRAFT_452620 [Chlamydoabsidia padenii]
MPRRSNQTRRSAPRQQTRQAHTVSQPPRNSHPPAPIANQPQQQNRQPGLFGQMASTAAGVAVGSTAGHAIGSLFTGGRGEQEPTEQQQYMDQQQYAGQQQNQQQEAVVGNCEADAKAFAKCLEENTNDISACQWYLDQLKSCRQMAQRY